MFAALDCAEIESADLAPTDIESAELDSAEIELVELAPAEIESAELESAELCSAELECVGLDSAVPIRPLKSRRPRAKPRRISDGMPVGFRVLPRGSDLTIQMSSYTENGRPKWSSQYG